MTTELDIAIQAARAAGVLLREHYYQPHQVEFKGVDNLVTEMDQRCERLIETILLDSFPEYGFYGEEQTRKNPNALRRWIVDPLDGTTGYSRAYPFFCTSIGLEEAGRPVVGAVFNPLLNEMFSAELGQGAFLNGCQLQVSAVDNLGQALLATGFPYGVWSRPDDNLSQFNRLTKRSLSVRNDGSAAIDLCHVAAGRLDGYWELEIEPWDVAAGAIIVLEAGGEITLAGGQPFDLFGRSALASNGKLHRTILNAMQE